MRFASVGAARATLLVTAIFVAASVVTVIRAEGQATTAPIQSVRGDGLTQVYLEDSTSAAGNQVMLWMKKSTGSPIVRYQSQFRQWDFTGGNFFTINDPSSGPIEMRVASNGDMTIRGNYFSATCTSPGSPCAPDFVFEADYPLMPLDELRAFIEREGHLPDIPSAAELEEQGVVNVSRMQMLLLQKIEELTLYTLQQQALIEQLMAERR